MRLFLQGDEALLSRCSINMVTEGILPQSIYNAHDQYKTSAVTAQM